MVFANLSSHALIELVIRGTFINCKFVNIKEQSKLTIKYFIKWLLTRNNCSNNIDESVMWEKCMRNNVLFCGSRKI